MNTPSLSATRARMALAMLVTLGTVACDNDPIRPTRVHPLQVPSSASPITIVEPLAVSPQWITFDAQLVGTPGPTRTIAVRNDGMTELTLTSIGIIGFHKDDFILDTEPTARCQVGVPIPPASSCNVYVAFVPSAAGARYGELKLEHATGIVGVPFEGLGLSAVDVGVAMTGAVTATKTVTYRITVTNAGPNDAIGVTITDALPITTSFVSIAGSQDLDCQVPAAGGAGGAVVCSVGSLQNGASRALEITVKALPGSKNSLTNSVSVSSVSYDGSTGNNKATVTTSLNGKKQ